MKKNVIIAALLLVLIAIILQLKCNTSTLDTTAFKNKIDSLQKNIDSIYESNQTAELKILQLQDKNDSLVQTKLELEEEIEDIKKDTQYIQIAKSYTPTQVDSFLEVKYTAEYSIKQKDTVQVPLPVAQSVVIDLLDFDKTKRILLKTDSLVNVLNQTNYNKDTIITTLRGKEANYNNIIFNKDSQLSNWKYQYNLVELQNKRLKFKSKFNKILTYVLIGGLTYTILK